MGAETLVVSPERVYGDGEAVPPSLSRSRRLRESESRFSLMLRLPARTHYPDNSPSFAWALSLSFPSYIHFFFSWLSHLGRGAPTIRDWFVTGTTCFLPVGGRRKKVVRDLIVWFNGYYSDRNVWDMYVCWIVTGMGKLSCYMFPDLRR